MENKMFCYQCQETAGCTGCTVMGVCGKNPEVAAMQDLLIYVTKGLAAVCVQLREEGKEVCRDTNHMGKVAYICPLERPYGGWSRWAGGNNFGGAGADFGGQLVRVREIGCCVRQTVKQKSKFLDSKVLQNLQ